MPVFISYSHQDKNFVDKLAHNLIENNVHIWLDRWELHIGDSLITKVQDAIQGASALLVILSKRSVNSDWCKKELNAGLIRELEEKKVIVLPVIIDNCDVPLFLKEKYYADFRENYDAGFNSILEGIAKVTSLVRARYEDLEYFTDWSIDWGKRDKNIIINITVVEHSKTIPYSVLTQFLIIANEQMTKRYNEIKSKGYEWFGRNVILEFLLEYSENNEIKFLLKDQFPFTNEIDIKDTFSEKGLGVLITCRWLGDDTGRDLVVNISNQLLQIKNRLRESGRPLTMEDFKKLNIKIHHKD